MATDSSRGLTGACNQLLPVSNQLVATRDQTWKLKRFRKQTGKTPETDRKKRKIFRKKSGIF